MERCIKTLKHSGGGAKMAFKQVYHISHNIQDNTAFKMIYK